MTDGLDPTAKSLCFAMRTILAIMAEFVIRHAGVYVTQTVDTQVIFVSWKSRQVRHHIRYVKDMSRQVCYSNRYVIDMSRQVCHSNRYVIGMS